MKHKLTDTQTSDPVQSVYEDISFREKESADNTNVQLLLKQS